jgi:hypothetical protein
MIKLTKHFNHKGLLLEPETTISLPPEMEDKLIKSESAERCGVNQKPAESQPNPESTSDSEDNTPDHNTPEDKVPENKTSESKEQETITILSPPAKAKKK